MKHEKLYISSMTCINCQTRIASALNDCSGITEVSVSYETGTAEFSYEPEMVSLDRIITMIDDLGYETSAQNTSKKKVILRAVREIVIIAVLFFLLQRCGILNRLVPNSLADSEMGYGMLFVIGLITSVHCIAMCGGINLSQTLQKDTSTEISSNDGKGHVYWKIHFGDQEKEAMVRVQVTAQDGTRRDYYLTLGITDQTPPELKKISASRISVDQASVVYKTSERGQCYYRVIEAGAKVQTPDTSKEGREVLKGSDTLTITGLSEGEKDVVIVVKDLAGNISSPMVIRIPDVRKKNNGTAGNGGNGNSGSIAQRPGYGGNKSEAGVPGKGNNGEGSLTNLKTVGGKGTASGKNGLDSTDENKEKKLTAYAGTKKKGSGSGTSGEKKSSKKADAVKDKTKEKTEESSTEELTESKEKETTSGTASASSKNEGKSIPELVGSKVTDTWTHMKLFTRILSLFALAGVLYLLLWTGARRSFRKIKSRNPLLQQ